MSKSTRFDRNYLVFGCEVGLGERIEDQDVLTEVRVFDKEKVLWNMSKRTSFYRNRSMFIS